MNTSRGGSTYPCPRQLKQLGHEVRSMPAELHRASDALGRGEKEDQAVRAISEIFGVGMLMATAAVATMRDPKAFSSRWELAAWAELKLKQTESGGKVNLHGIIKRGAQLAHPADSRCAKCVDVCERA